MSRSTRTKTRRDLPKSACRWPTRGASRATHHIKISPRAVAGLPRVGFSPELFYSAQRQANVADSVAGLSMMTVLPRTFCHIATTVCWAVISGTPRMRVVGIRP